MSHAYFKQFVDFYRGRYEQHRAEGRHAGREGGIVGAGGAIYVRPRSQDAWQEFRPAYDSHPILSSSGSLEDAVATTGLNVGSPTEIVEQVLAQRDLFGEYQRQLFAVDMAGIAEQTVHEELELIGAEVVPALRRELASHAVLKSEGEGAR
jgi:hypothetical protein